MRFDRAAWFWNGVLAIAVTLVAPTEARAETITTCSSLPPSQCGWMLFSADLGQEFSETPDIAGTFVVDPETGDVGMDPTSMAEIMNFAGDGFSLDADAFSFGGNVDPILTFGVGLTQTVDFKTYAFAFSLPIGGISGPIDSAVDFDIDLASNGGSSGTDPLILFPLRTDNVILDSNDISLPSSADGFHIVDKGIDLAVDPGALPSDPATFGISSFKLGTPVFGFIPDTGFDYEVMSVVLEFGLDGHGSASFTGDVRQTVVPEPTATLLITAGLLGLAWSGRRRPA